MDNRALHTPITPAQLASARTLARQCGHAWADASLDDAPYMTVARLREKTQTGDPSASWEDGIGLILCHCDARGIVWAVFPNGDRYTAPRFLAQVLAHAAR